MKISILLSLTALLLSPDAFAQPDRPDKIHGALRVAGNQMIDKEGNPAQLRGISLSWSLWAGKKYYNPDVVDWLVKDFKISLLRASMGVQPDHGYLNEPEEQMRLMTAVIDQSIKNGIYVLIDWHDHNAELHVEKSKAFFTIMAQKYSGVPNILYEIFNEPARQSWEVVKNYSVEVIRTIRRYDSKNIIVIGSPRWDQDVDIAASDPIKGFDNLVYSFHFYASDPSHQEKLRVKADFAIQKGLPLFVTEWGIGESNGNGAFNREKTANWMEWMEQNRLSWANWNLTDKKETTALLSSGAPVNGGCSKDELSEAGKFIRKELHRLNK